MRLLIALPDAETACAVQAEMEYDGWDACVSADGVDAWAHLQGENCDVALVHLCLPGIDGQAIGQRLPGLICPPRVLLVAPVECLDKKPAWADCVVCAGASPVRLCALLRILAQKPLPMLAAARQKDASVAAVQFLDAIALSARFKGRAYAVWLLERMVVSPSWERQPLAQLYSACAARFGVTQASVERCLRVAVESVFTQGSMRGIERFFGATIDPERGKPTNRAFLLQAVQQLRTLLRHSRTAARSPNSSEMHHSPAAPTSV